jgi:sulfur carrier protein
VNIIVNGEDKEISNTKLHEVLIELGYTGKKLATALNGNFVSIEDRKNTALSEGDKIEVLSPQQGG